MISYIFGQVVEMTDGQVILDNNGIGYSIATSEQSMSHFHVGSEYKIYTVMVGREDGLYLYGFYDQEERLIFQLLNKVSAVGPKVALSLLSTLTVKTITTAILTNDANCLTQAPGIGKKTASRIILELLDKVKSLGYVAGEIKDDFKQEEEENENYQIAMEALINLGYARNEAEKALAGWDENTKLEEGIRLALRKLS